MALVKAKTAVPERPINYDDPIASKIQQRRYQMLVHSYLYYGLDISLVSDHQWMQWAQELVELQKNHPSISARVVFADAFKGFDGSTGCHLPYNDDRIVNIAHRLLRIHEKQEGVKMEVRPAPTVPKKEVKPVEKRVHDKLPRKGLFTVSGR